MISMVVYSKEKKELKKIKSKLENLVPVLSDEKWHFYWLSELEEFTKQVEKLNGGDLLIVDITHPGALEALEQFRKTYTKGFLMLIASTDISPMSYMKPSIKAASLLLRPIDEENMQDVLKEFLIDFINQREAIDLSHTFKIEAKGEVHYIPYNDIYYFEARKRKLYLRTLNEEYQFLDTVDNLEKNLGEQFIRCHRSFIVNVRKIISIALVDNIITLTHDLVVPLSRGYKSNIKHLK